MYHEVNKLVSAVRENVQCDGDVLFPHVSIPSVNDIFSAEQIIYKIQIGPYAGLNQAGRQKAREFADLLFHIDNFRDDPDVSNEMPRLLRLYDIPVSAGSGNFIDDCGYEMIKAPTYVPANVDFALRISGNSMTPLYQDGQIIWIKEQAALSNGEIGIFVYSGDVFCNMATTVTRTTGSLYRKPTEGRS